MTNHALLCGARCTAHETPMTMSVQLGPGFPELRPNEGPDAKIDRVVCYDSGANAMLRIENSNGFSCRRLVAATDFAIK